MFSFELRLLFSIYTNFSVVTIYAYTFLFYTFWIVIVNQNDEGTENQNQNRFHALFRMKNQQCDYYVFQLCSSSIKSSSRRSSIDCSYICRFTTSVLLL